MKHAGSYARKILIQHYAFVVIVWVFALIGVVTTAYFGFQWWSS